MAQVRTKANNLTVSLKDRGQEIAVKELDLLSDAALGGKKAIQSPKVCLERCRHMIRPPGEYP